MYILLNLSNCVKSYGQFMSNFDLFYNEYSPNMLMSRDSSYRF